VYYFKKQNFDNSACTSYCLKPMTTFKPTTIDSF